MCSKFVSHKERVAFLALKQYLNIRKHLRSGDNRHIFWNNLRDYGTYIIAKLDKFYTPIYQPRNSFCVPSFDQILVTIVGLITVHYTIVYDLALECPGSTQP